MRAFADHLMNIARHERIVSLTLNHRLQVENERIRLNEITYFQPEAALRRITQYTNHRPKAEDIRDFLLDTGYNVELEDAKILIKAYDSDRDGLLHNTEFLFLIISATDSKLRQSLTLRAPIMQAGDTATLGAGAMH